MRKESVKNILKFWLGTTILVLAIAIIYFANTLLKVNKNVPSIIDQVALINQNIDTITTKSIPSILDEIPKITTQINNVQSKIPSLLKETKNIREITVPNILTQVKNVNNQIPNILNRIDTINAKIPSITSSISKATFTANEALARVDSINKQIPSIIATIQTTNDSISSYLIQAKMLVEEANEIAKTAGEDATKGFLTGIISTPFNLTGSLGDAIFGGNDIDDINKNDLIDIESRTLIFLNKNNGETETSWIHFNKNNLGKIQVLRTFIRRGKQVKKLLITLKKIGMNEEEKRLKVYFFKKKDGQWNFWK